METAAGVYRTSGGMPCPACGKRFLLGTPDERVSCAHGCGTWYPLPALEALIDPNALTNCARHWWRHGKVRRCLVCAVPMTVAGRASITIDLCRKHGMWLAATRRVAFERVFDDELQARRTWVRPATATPQPSLEPQIAALVVRIEALEAELAELRRRR